MDFNELNDEQLIELLRKIDDEKNSKKIENILNNRGYEIEYKENITENQSNNQRDSAKHSLRPLTIGILFVLASFIGFAFTIDHDTQNLINLSSNMIIRIISVLWLIELAKGIKSNQYFWGVLGLIFGGWALSVMGIIYATLED